VPLQRTVGPFGRHDDEYFNLNETLVPNTFELLIEGHYSDLGLIKPWPLSRAHNLCQMLGCTLKELCQMYLMGNATRWQMLQEQQVHQSDVLHFYPLEQSLLGNPPKPLIPVWAFAATKQKREAELKAIEGTK